MEALKESFKSYSFRYRLRMRPKLDCKGSTNQSRIKCLPYGKERALMKIWASKSLWTSWFWKQLLNTSEKISLLLHKHSSVTELGELQFLPHWPSLPPGCKLDSNLSQRSIKPTNKSSIPNRIQYWFLLIRAKILSWAVMIQDLIFIVLTCYFRVMVVIC